MVRQSAPWCESPILMRPRILVIDDDQASCRLIGAIFRSESCDVIAAHDGPSGIVAAASQHPDVVLLDLRLPGLDGMAVLERLKAESPLVPVVMLTGSHDVKDAVSAIRAGAFDYLTKPIRREEIILVARRAQQTHAMSIELQALRQQAGKFATDNLSAQMGSGKAVQRVIEQVRLVAVSTFSVLILGETGTGKELVSQAVHRMSDRRLRPFVALDCGAIPDALLESELFGHERGAFTGADRRKEGRFRLAEGGTCFLDEIGNLAPNLQAKLLRVLESGQVQAVGADRATPMDVRFIAATNQDLQDRVEQGTFRSDLYFRLAQYAIRLPALRERTDDIPFLTHRFVEEAAHELRHPIEAITPGALELLLAYSWPGNVRELRNVVRQAVLQSAGLAINADSIRGLIGNAGRASDAAPASAPGASLREIANQAAAAAERRAIRDALRTASGNKAAAARALKTDYKTLHVKIKNLGIEPR